MNVDQQRIYQDSIIELDSIPQNQLNRIGELISDYKKYEPQNSDKYYFNYLLAKLYSEINYMPFYQLFYDSLSKKMIRPEMYSSYLDSSYYYAKKALELNSSDILSMRILSSTLYTGQDSISMPGGRLNEDHQGRHSPDEMDEDDGEDDRERGSSLNDVDNNDDEAHDNTRML
jgi:hypothetical protein